MNEKKVFLIRNVARDKFGGAEIYQIKLAKKLKEAGFLPIILTNSKKLLEGAKNARFKTLIPPYLERQNWSGLWNLGLPMYYFYQLRLMMIY